MNKQKIQVIILGILSVTLLVVGGFLVAKGSNWITLVGTFLMIWGNNAGFKPKDY